MIELSIVLLILSLLVGSLLVGRQIVDRAKIQRIIFEFDYYEKAFHQFYDTYRAVPGSLSYKECIKHAEFAGPACGRDDYACQNGNGTWTYNYNHSQWCQQYTLDVAAGNKLISSTWVGKWALYHLLASKLIDQTDPGFRPSIAVSMEEKNGDQSNAMFNGGWRGKFFQTTFDKSVYLKFVAYHKRNAISLGGLSTNAMLGENYFLNKIFDKNTIFMYGLIFKQNGNALTSATDTFTSALNSKLASELDAKIDDGRPTTGTLLAIKPSKAYNETDAERSKQYCYDASGNDIEHAIYNTSTNTQYGCDLIKVMEDVK